MITVTATEIIFRGIVAKTCLSFLLEFLDEYKEVWFNAPEVNVEIDFNVIIKTIKDNSYVDFVITTDKLKFDKHIVENGFINLRVDDNKLELLLFFDLKDLNCSSHKNSIDLLMTWANSFKEKYDFESIVCQLDNGNEKEYYFDGIGTGPLYDQLV
jgi:hypothetical protein